MGSRSPELLDAAIIGRDMNSTEEEVIRGNRIYTRVKVSGYDTGLPHDDDDDVERALRTYFSSCGEITDVYIDTLARHALVYLCGEGAQDKALELDGSNLEGWNNPCLPDPDPKLGFMVEVTGYEDSGLDESVIESRLRKRFSSCGEITRVSFGSCSAVVCISGEGVEDKVLNLLRIPMWGIKAVPKRI
ncbi:hypothetical protein Bca101_052756 [Brassica carinata]